MGASSSQLEKQIGSEQFPANERYFGLANFGNTCYCNSVLQALYFCKPFRDKVLEYKSKNKRNTNRETLLTCLADLYHNIATQKKKTGTIAPKKFVAKLRKENQVFDNYHQQDAHEFLNYLLNTIGDLLNEESNSESSNLNSNSNVNSNGCSNNTTTTNSTNPQQTNSNNLHKAQRPNSKADHSSSPNNKTWIHEIFQGTLTNETRCLNCESLSSKDEDFLDLSVEILANSSITHCLDVFSNTETLSSEHKYYCENCCSKQEATKRMLIKKSPMILALHLKRFKYMESQSRHTKLTYRVVFPLELRIFNKTGTDDEKLYDLVAVVIHCGPGPNRGHYISIVKSFGLWLLFDDELVDKIDAYSIEEFFGLTNDQKTSESGYILFYQEKT